VVKKLRSVRGWWLEEVKHGGRRARGWGPFDFGEDRGVCWLAGGVRCRSRHLTADLWARFLQGSLATHVWTLTLVCLRGQHSIQGKGARNSELAWTGFRHRLGNHVLGHTWLVVTLVNCALFRKKYPYEWEEGQHICDHMLHPFQMKGPV